MAAPPLFFLTHAQATASINTALAAREHEVRTLGMLNVLLSQGGGARGVSVQEQPMFSSDNYIFCPPPFECFYLNLPGKPTPPALICALRRKPLPAVPVLWRDPATGTLQYAHEGTLVLFADHRVEVILPADWPTIWAAHNAARATLHLPPQPDPLSPAADQRLSPFLRPHKNLQ
jgi:hypothetical protein